MSCSLFSGLLMRNPKSFNSSFFLYKLFFPSVLEDSRIFSLATIFWDFLLFVYFIYFTGHLALSVIGNFLELFYSWFLFMYSLCSLFLECLLFGYWASWFGPLVFSLVFSFNFPSLCSPFWESTLTLSFKYKTLSCCVFILCF